MKKLIYYIFLSLAVIAMFCGIVRSRETNQPVSASAENTPVVVSTAMVEYRIPLMVARSYYQLLLRLSQGAKDAPSDNKKRPEGLSHFIHL